MKIGIFCSANNRIDADFFTQTEALGQYLGQHGHAIVFGGCNMGLMECIAKSVHEAGGRTIGVIPRIVEQGGRVSQYVDVEIPCENLSDRKDLMLLQSDVIVALPGGIGTLDEIFTVAAAHTIGYHQKKLLLFNVKDFYRPLINMLDDLQERGMVRGDWHDYMDVCDNLDDLLKSIEK